MGSRKDLVAALRGAGRRVTPQRQVILEYLGGRTDHPSAGQIHRNLTGRVPSLSLATVYNTLATLTELGLVREIEFDGADNRYDTNLAPHVNLVCVRCGDIMDYQRELPVRPDEIRSATGFEVVTCRVEYRGLCATCSSARGE
jgi:Fur family peroxide stress response transcriptional regulator